MKNIASIIWHNAVVTRDHREKLNGHKSCVLWFTGLSGAGKSTLAHAVEAELHRRCYQTFVLDGDNVRHGLSSNLGFSEIDRRENIRRIGEVSKLMMESGIIVMTAFISPFRQDRDAVRKLISNEDFFEIYCKANLEICEKRDVKGFYKKARAGEIKNYTGIDSPYEEPITPELIVETDRTELSSCVGQVLRFLQEKGVCRAPTQ